jgi:hypothetical protein
MKKYRIIEIECYGGRKVYEVQKRLLGCLWWYNFQDDGFWGTGVYDTQKEAEDTIERDMYISKKTVVKTY